MAGRWQFWIDRGGTFTDCIGVSPTGERVVTKVLSSDRAPLIGIRELLGLTGDAPIPPCEVRMGTTLATNALLERQGVSTGLVITRGFADLLAIGTQARSSLFALDIVKPAMLYREVLEVDARMDANGLVLAEDDTNALRASLSALRARGIESLAVVLIHAYRDPRLEVEIGRLAREIGFKDVSLSSEVSGEMGMLGRGDTSVVDAYLTPLLRRYLDELRAELPGSRVLVMQSSGGLTSAELFRGKNAVLSGPAGGVIAYSAIAKAAGYASAIGFDMGGTSTDVSCFDGELERSYESEVAGVRLRAAMMSIHTVAAGGGSICRDNGFRFTVGPESAGAQPGPLCYGHAEATELTLTDCNLALGRMVDDRFPFALERQRCLGRIKNISEDLARRGIEQDPMQVAAGFVEIANANMAAAIREVTIAKGRDLRDFAMVVFGGAGGQHACALARSLGIRSLLLDELGGVLSAYGMGLAPLSWHGQGDAGLRDLAALAELEARFDRLLEEGRAALTLQGASDILCRRFVDLRYVGTDSSITIEVSEDIRCDFEAAHERRYGYTKGDAIEIVTLRVEVQSPSSSTIAMTASRQGPSAPIPLRHSELWDGESFVSVPVFGREQLGAGLVLEGPLLILDATATLVLDAGWTATLQPGRRLLLEDRAPSVGQVSVSDLAVDPIRMEIFANLFMSTANQMGTTLRETAVSTNIRERLDFSCAVFDAEGGLVANAPHIPVHLGAMSESIRGILQLHPRPRPGAVYASNDPNLGGSHLPDITVVTPVHDDAGKLIFFTACRGHHADVGGSTPGSMPPFSTSIEEEGVVLRGICIVDDGVFDEAGLRKLFASGRYPARKISDNLSDLRAQIAANQCGVELLRRLLTQRGPALVLSYMKHVQDNAAEQVASCIAALPDGHYRFADRMDEGTPVQVSVEIVGARMRIDFAGTGQQTKSNLNAPRAVTVAAVIYVLRCLVGTSIPLNSGCLRSVDLHIPEHSLLHPDAGCAVAAGNVETSQRVVDVLLASLGLAAASQGSMNNLSFGNETFGYYETIAGGAGATCNADGASGVHTHMTNTRITDPEILEARYPVRLVEFSLRKGSGGAGRHRGGDGLCREIEALEPLQVSIISERRSVAPFGLAGGASAKVGRNLHNGKALGGKCSFAMQVGDRLRIETPGGGGYGPEAS